MAVVTTESTPLPQRAAVTYGRTIRPAEWNFEEFARFEAAIDVLTQQAGYCTAHLETTASESAAARLRELRASVLEQRQALRPTDTAKIDEILATAAATTATLNG